MEVLKEMPRRDPINGTFELTVRCNLKCKMCLFRHDDSENKEIMAKEMTAEEWIDMARQVAEAGTMNLLITGGEPMLRPDFCDIYEGIYKQGFIIELYTNATLVSDKIMDTLRKYPPHKIGVTLYGASAETYKKVCGNGKAFDMCIKGITRLRELPSKMEFRTTIIKDNYSDFDSIENLVHERFDKNARIISTNMVIKSVRGGCCDVASCRLSPNENREFNIRRQINNIKKFVGEENFNIENIVFNIDDLENNSNNKENKKRITLFGCDAGMQSYTITWDGKLLACQILGEFYNYPYEEGFEKSWNSYPKLVKTYESDNICINCNNKDICAPCYAFRYAETEGLGGCPNYICNHTTELKKLL